MVSLEHRFPWSQDCHTLLYNTYTIENIVYTLLVSNIVLCPIRHAYCLFFVVFFKFEFLFNEDSQYTGVWKYCDVYKTLRCLSKIYYTLRCLENICSVSSPLRRHKTLTIVLLTITNQTINLNVNANTYSIIEFLIHPSIAIIVNNIAWKHVS